MRLESRSKLESVLLVGGIVAFVALVVLAGIFTYRNEEHFLFKAKLVDIKNGSTPYLVFDNGKLITWPSLSTVQIGKTYNVYETTVGIFFVLTGNRIVEVKP